MAVATVAEAFGIDQDADPSGVDALEKAATTKMLEFYAPVAAIAARMATVVEEARTVRAVAVARSAEDAAARADVIAAALQLTADRAEAAAAPRGDEAKSVDAAGKFTQALDEAAAGIAALRAAAAPVVIEFVQATAAGVAEAAEAAAIAVETETNDAAAIVQPLARATCYQLALVAAASAADFLCTRQAVSSDT